jgi:homoserine kinase
MPLEKVTVLAPATVANIGPGFDVFGLALAEPFDLVTAERRNGKGVKVRKVEGLGEQQLAGADFGITLNIKKGVRPCSGMGSSGASAAGGAFAANLLLDEPLGKDTLVHCAAKGEQASSGSYHADNVSPSLLGGFTIIISYDPLDVIRITPPPNLGVVAALPDMLVATKEARGVLPQEVEMRKMVLQVGRASALAAAMALGDVKLIGRCVHDAIVEPARAPLVPHLRQAESAALKAGAIASFLGGSGPCVASFFDTDTDDGKGIAEAVRKVYARNGMDCATWVTGWGEGCRRWEK